jgi:hypothetical protein
MDAQTLKDQAETIAILRYVLEENAKHFDLQQAASLRKKVEYFIPYIIQNWEDDEMVDELIDAINSQYTQQLLIDATSYLSK